MEKANNGNRTRDLLITNQLLYHLSYVGAVGSIYTTKWNWVQEIQLGKEISLGKGLNFFWKRFIGWIQIQSLFPIRFSLSGISQFVVGVPNVLKDNWVGFR